MFDLSTHRDRRAILIVALIIPLIFGGYWLEQHIASIESWIQSMGHWAGIVFIILFVLLTPLFFSVDALCVIAGAIFDLPTAIAYVLIATMIAAALIFFIGHSLAKQKIQAILKQHPRLATIDELVERGGIKMLFLIRLLPLPFALVSYALSVSSAKFKGYWVTTTGIFFYNAAITYFGYMAVHLSKQLSQGGDYTGPCNNFLLGGILICLLVLYLITRIAKTEISKINASGDSPF